MNRNAKIFIAGAAGMVGSAIIRKCLAMGYTNLIGSYRSRIPSAVKYFLNDNTARIPPELRLVKVDLTCQEAIEQFFSMEAPEYVLIAAAKVGGIHANNTYPAQFIYENSAIQNNIIHAAYQHHVTRLLFLGSSCIYPKLAPQPMKEEYLLTDLPEPTNEPYAVAKIAGIKMCEAYNRQYGTCFIAVMPTNLYGPNDNFDPADSHVLPALIRKFHTAKFMENKEVVVWGTGMPRREFLHINDMADACLFVMNLDDKTIDKEFLRYPNPCFVNVGSGIDCTIKDLAKIIQNIVEFDGRIVYDTSKPDGTSRKLLDVSRLTKLGWKSVIGLAEGVKQTYQWYQGQASIE
jgi:GDP-L-fucose synthase